MSVPASSNDEESAPGSSRSNCIRGHDEPAPVSADNFFTADPSEYIDSKTVLPASESREQLNHFFDETTSTTPAENAELLHQESTLATGVAGEPETFGETQVGKFLKKLFAKK